jgi:hypothetical protein
VKTGIVKLSISNVSEARPTGSAGVKTGIVKLSNMSEAIRSD